MGRVRGGGGVRRGRGGGDGLGVCGEGSGGGCFFFFFFSMLWTTGPARRGQRKALAGGTRLTANPPPATTTGGRTVPPPTAGEGPRPANDAGGTPAVRRGGPTWREPGRGSSRPPPPPSMLGATHPPHSGCHLGLLRPMEAVPLSRPSPLDLHRAAAAGRLLPPAPSAAAGLAAAPLGAAARPLPGRRCAAGAGGCWAPRHPPERAAGLSRVRGGAPPP